MRTRRHTSAQCVLRPRDAARRAACALHANDSVGARAPERPSARIPRASAASMSGVAPAGSQSNSIPSMPPLPAMAWRPLPKSSSMPTPPPPPDLRAEAMSGWRKGKNICLRQILHLFLCVGSVCFEMCGHQKITFHFCQEEETRHYVHCFEETTTSGYRGQAHFGLPREAPGFRHDAEAQCDRMGRKEVE